MSSEEVASSTTRFILDVSCGIGVNAAKNSDAEKRVARHNGRDEWAVSDQPELRILSDELWSAVKRL